MDLQLNGKTALVTGSTQGIGFAIARGLAAEGAAVIVNGRSEDRVSDAVARIRADLPQAEVGGMHADLGSRDGVDQLTAHARRCDILVNNVGLFGPTDFLDIDDETWQRYFDVNVMSAVRLSRFYLPGMLEQGWGRLLFVSSESGIHIPPEMVHYGFTKSALLSLSRGIAESFPGTGVTSNAILPGPTRSEGVSDMLADMGEPGQSAEQIEREFIDQARPSSLIKRLATPEEVANLAVYLASPLSSATNGAPMRVDGGVVRAMA